MPTYFCTKADMQTQLSLYGLIAFSDHEETGSEDDIVIDAMRLQATQELEGYLTPLYDTDQLASSSLVARWCAILACCDLTRTRGNQVPESLYDACEKITAKGGMIDQTKAGTFIIPGLIRKSTNAPSFSNLTIDRRYRREKIRVIRANSGPIESALERDHAPEIVLDI